MEQNLLNYIKENLEKGVSQDQIRQSLISSGWQSTDIDAAFLQLNSQQQLKPPQISIKEQKAFFNPKILTAAIVLALLLTAGGTFYFFFFKEKPVTPENQTTSSESQKQTVANQDQSSTPQNQPSQTETNWKTYTNQKWGWEVKYPGSWQVIVGTQDCSLKGGGESEDAICFLSPDFGRDEVSGFGFQVFTENFDPDFVNNCFSLPQEQCQKLTIAGQNATKIVYEYRQPEALNEEEYTFSFPNKSQIMLTFDYLPCEAENRPGCYRSEDAQNQINQILSTFKFL